MLFHQIGHLLKIARCQNVRQRLNHLSLLLEPLGSPAMQHRGQFGLLLLQPCPQQFTKEMMITRPLPILVQRDQE